MTASMLRRLLASALALAVTGCGTVLNLNSGSYPVCCCPNAEPQKVYGGVLLDADAGQKLIQRGVIYAKLPSVAFGLWTWTVDLPLSAVGDTLTLPVTLVACNRAKTAESPAPAEQIPLTNVTQAGSATSGACDKGPADVPK